MKKATRTSYAKYIDFQLKRQNLTDFLVILVNFLVSFSFIYHVL